MIKGLTYILVRYIFYPDSVSSKESPVPCVEGRSGNPAGRPRGCRNKANRDAEATLSAAVIPASPQSNELGEQVAQLLGGEPGKTTAESMTEAAQGNFQDQGVPANNQQNPDVTAPSADSASMEINAASIPDQY